MNELFGNESIRPVFNLEEFNDYCEEYLPHVYFMDTETSGLNGEVIEFTLMSLDGNTVFNSRCKPLINFIDNGATAVHGITLNDLKYNKTFYEYLNKIIKHLSLDRAVSSKGGSFPIIMYNSEFDKRIIGNSLRLENKFKKSSLVTRDSELFFNRDFPCVMKLISEQNKKNGLGSKWMKLIDASKQFKIDIEESKLHGSLYDTLLTRAIFINLVKTIGNDIAKKRLTDCLGENLGNEKLMTINESVLKSNTNILNN